MRRRNTQRWLAATGTVAIGLVTAVAGVATAPAASAAKQVAGKPIVVGGNGDFSLSPGLAQGFEAGIYRFNKAGGLDGRKIKFVGFLNDGYDPQKNLTNAQQLVQNDHVFAVAPVSSAVATAATGTFLANNKVPFIGYSVSADFETQPKWGFGINGTNTNPDVQSLAAATHIMEALGQTKNPGKVKMALIAENVPGGSVSIGAVAGVVKYLGMKVVYQKATIPIVGTTNYDPYAEAIMSSGANAVFEILSATDVTGLTAALKTANFQGKTFNAITYLPGLLGSQPNQAAALNGAYVTNQFPVNENKTPAVLQEEKDLKAIGQKPYLYPGVSIGYWSAIMFEEMLQATLAKAGGDPAKVTPELLQRTVTGGFTFKSPLSGGMGTLYFPVGNTIPSGCGTLVKTVGTRFQQITPYQCLGNVNVTLQKKISLKTGEPIG